MEKIKKQLFHLQVKRFSCSEDAFATAKALAKKWKPHRLENIRTVEYISYTSKGRSAKYQKPSVIKYQLLVEIQEDEEKINHKKTKEGFYVIGGNTAPSIN